MKTLQKIVGHPLGYPFLLLLVGAASYLMQLKGMGFYWDDWQAVFLWKINDPQITSAYFLYDRPFSAWTYNMLFPWFSMNPAMWQILTLLARWGAVLFFVAALLLLWPKRKWQIQWAGIFLLVYPSFMLQSVSVAFNQHFITMLLYCSSLWLMGKAVTHKRHAWVFIPLAVAATLGHLFTMEYFIGLEAFRLAYLYFLIRKDEINVKAALGKVFLTWLPFGLCLGSFIYWRLLIYPAQVPDILPNDPVLLKEILQKPLIGLLDLATRVIQDILYLFVNSWADTVAVERINFLAKANLFSWAIGIIIALIAAGWLLLSNKIISSDNHEDHFYSHGSILSLVAILLGGLPVWVIGRQMSEGGWSVRFSLAPMFGATIFAVILIDWLLRTQKQKYVFLAVLAGLAVAVQIQTVNKYRLDWDNQRNFFWQLSWRAPEIKPGTAIFGSGIPSGKLSDYATGFGLNVLYGKNLSSPVVPYWFLTLRNEGYSFYKLEPGYEISYKFRNIQFTGSTSEAFSLSFQPASGCLRVLDPVYLLDPLLKSSARSLFLTTNLSTINSSSQIQPDKAVFGKEPSHGWCYYFQKADLARQQSQWQEVIQFMNEAQGQNYSPMTAGELLPLLDAYVNTGAWEQAVNTVTRMQEISEEINPFVCAQLERYEGLEGVQISKEFGDKVKASALCDLVESVTP